MEIVKYIKNLTVKEIIILFDLSKHCTLYISKHKKNIMSEHFEREKNSRKFAYSRVLCKVTTVSVCISFQT